MLFMHRQYMNAITHEEGTITTVRVSTNSSFVVGRDGRGSAMTQRITSPHAIYRVCVRSILDEGWVRTLPINPIATHRHYVGPPRTILVLQITDQSELLGLLNQLHNMGLTLLSVEMNVTQTN